MTEPAINTAPGAAERDSGDSGALYAVCDLRRDGKRRIVGEFTDPSEAARAAQLLRWAGADATVELITSVRS